MSVSRSRVIERRRTMDARMRCPPLLDRRRRAMPVPLNLAERIRTKLDSGLLPTQDPEKTYGRFGTGHSCHGCDEPISRAQVEYEKVFADGSAFRFHMGCAGLYEGERLLGRERSKPRALQPNACDMCGRPFGTSDLIEYRIWGGVSAPVHVACSAAQRRKQT